MTINPTQSQHARSANPLFDQVVADIRPKPGRTLSPITTLSRYLDRAAAPTAAAAAARPAAPAAATPTITASSVAQATARGAAPATRDVDLDRIAQTPLDTADLTPEERAIVAEMGGTVALLILNMLRHGDSRPQGPAPSQRVSRNARRHDAAPPVIRRAT